MKDLIESYINGNKDWVFKQYDKMNPNEKEQFIQTVRYDCDSQTALNIYRSLLIRMI